MRIETDVLRVLTESRVEGPALFLPAEQLERGLYVRVNKVLELIGGKWNRSKKAHLFAECPDELVETVVLTGEVTDRKKQFQFFETPVPIAVQAVDWAEIEVGHSALEPSAGRGRIAREIARKTDDLMLIELDPDNHKYLAGITPSERLICEDFLGLRGAYFDRIVMNPPFSRQQDVEHIEHAWRCLRPRGVLVSIVSESPFFRSDKRSVAFRDFLDQHRADVKDMSAGAFSESGTGVKTRIVRLRRAA